MVMLMTNHNSKFCFGLIFELHERRNPNDLVDVCSSIQELEAGEWHYSDFEDESSRKFCPDQLQRSHKAYACGLHFIRNSESPEPLDAKNPFHMHATYENLNCKENPLSITVPSLIKNLTSKNQTVLFVGDSLTLQYYNAVLCAAEKINKASNIFDKYCKMSISRSLRDGIDIDSSHYLSINERLIKNHWAPNISVLITSKQDDWQLDLSIKKTYAIIIGNGAWYNYERKSVINPIQQYEKTMKIVYNILKTKVSNKTKILWTGLPPFNPVLNNNFLIFDQIASKYISLLPNGYFLNVSLISGERNEKDSRISYDGQHWCNFAETSIPIIIARKILHILSTD